MSLHSQFLPASHSQLAIWHQSDGSGVCFSATWLTHWLKIFLKGIPERMPAPGTKWACPTPGAEEGCLYALIGQRHHSLNPHRPGTRGLRWSSLLTNANTHTHPPSTMPMSIKGTPLDVLQRPWLVLKIMSEKTLWAQVLELGCCCTLRRKRQEQESVVFVYTLLQKNLLLITNCMNKIGFWGNLITLISYMQEWFWTILKIKQREKRNIFLKLQLYQHKEPFYYENLIAWFNCLKNDYYFFVTVN